MAHGTHPRTRSGRALRRPLSGIAALFALAAFSVITAPLGFAGSVGSWTIDANAPNPGTSANVLNGQACVRATTYCLSVGDYANSGGRDQTLVEYNDSVVSSPNKTTTNDNVLLGASCVTVSDCWATGYYLTGSPGGSSQIQQTLIEGNAGRGWQIVSSPNTGMGSNLLSGVACITATNCWAVGGADISGSGVTLQPLFEHYAGHGWSVVAGPQVPGDTELFDVSCVNASDCWAVGATFAGAGSQTLIEHYNGSAWSVVSGPASTDSSNELHGVSCVASNDCVAAGWRGTSGTQTLIEKYNGTAWSIVNSPNGPDTGSQVTDELLGVSCASRTFCAAVGYYYNGTVYVTLMLQSTGGAWAIVSSPSPAGSFYSPLLAVDCTGGCWAVGSASPSGAQQVLSEHRTGDSTNTVVSCAPNPVTLHSRTTCTAHVVDTGLTSNVPGGNVRWSGGPGTFNAVACALKSSGSCSVTFTPSATGSQSLSATYRGDATHAGSYGSTTLHVT